MSSYSTLTSSRQFEHQDQLLFAQLSGDWNPLHVDHVAARRTQAGTTVVHGMHVALWALEAVSGELDLDRLAEVDVRFLRFVHPGGSADLSVNERRGRAVIDVHVAGKRTTQISCRFGAAADLKSSAFDDAPIWQEDAREPNVLSLEEAARTSGRVAVLAAQTKPERLFPRLVDSMGPTAVAALMRISMVVGMVCPGRHSIFSTLSVKRVHPLTNAIAYRTTGHEAAFRLIRMAVAGGGWHGDIEAFLAHPPVAQPNFEDIARLVPRDVFAGQRVLVLGGSRGLGEVVSKIAAAGGAQVCITYVLGEGDARAVSDDINCGGGHCTISKLDVSERLDTQLAEMEHPTHLYYFPTSQIFAASQDELLASGRLSNFWRLYVTGFYDCCCYFSAKGAQLKVFYPSSIAIDERPKGMTEYTMAKAAGEILAADVSKYMPGVDVKVVRLPRIFTDQTASVVPAKSADALSVMLPLVRDFQTPSLNENMS